jgi:6-phosphogluconolactonase
MFRKIIVTGGCCVLVFLQTLASAQTLYIGTYTGKGSKGIYVARFRPGRGELSGPELAAETPDPSFLAANRLAASPTGKSPRYLYAANEGSAEVSAFAVAPDSGKLTFLNKQETGGGGPCHLALDATGRMLVVANYGGGSIASYPIGANGQIGPRRAFIAFTGSGPNAQRQEAPHAHAAVFSPDNRFVLINDLGTDRTMVYHVHPENAALQPADPAYARADAGAGPRHLAFGPGGHFVYVVNELASTVTRFAWEPGSGTLKKMGSVSALPAGFHGSNTAAEIVIAPGGRALYTSNRGHDSVAVFSIASDGGLRLIQNVATGGHAPRSFTLDPSGRWLLAANQDSNNITVFRVDPETGRIAATGKSIEVPSPVCLLFP